MRRDVRLSLLLAGLGSLAPADEAALAPVPALDLQRYAGVWYEVARLAHPKGPPSRLKVRFAPAFLSLLPAEWGDYCVIDLAPDYSYAWAVRFLTPRGGRA